jgi:hypothetical protein
MLVCSKRKVLLADCWWLICFERKVLLSHFENVWQNGFTCWIEVLKVYLPFIFFFFLFLFIFSFSFLFFFSLTYLFY